jgi:hypothetical protein
MLIPFELFAYITNDTSNASLQQLRLNLSRVKPEHTSASYGSISRKEVNPAIIQYLPQNFNENERAYEARLQIMEFKEAINPLDVKLWHKYERFSKRFGIYSSQEVQDALKNSTVCAAILPLEYRIPPNSKGTKYGLYQLVITPQP